MRHMGTSTCLPQPLLGFATEAHRDPSAYSATAASSGDRPFLLHRPPHCYTLTAVAKIQELIGFNHRDHLDRSNGRIQFGKHHLSSVQTPPPPPNPPPPPPPQCIAVSKYQHLPQQRHPTTLTFVMLMRGTRAVPCPWLLTAVFPSPSHVLHARRCYKSQGPRRYAMP